jgi:hypothetical protein
MRASCNLRSRPPQRFRVSVPRLSNPEAVDARFLDRQLRNGTHHAVGGEPQFAWSAADYLKATNLQQPPTTDAESDGVRCATRARDRRSWFAIFPHRFAELGARFLQRPATPAPIRSAEHALRSLSFVPRLLMSCVTSDVTIDGEREWQDKGRALTRTHVRGSARKNVAPGVAQTAPDASEVRVTLAPPGAPTARRRATRARAQRGARVAGAVRRNGVAGWWRAVDGG